MPKFKGSKRIQANGHLNIPCRFFMPYLTVTLLGTYTASRQDAAITTFRSVRVQALLAYLAVETGRVHQRDSLVGLLWSEQPPKEANANFRKTLSRLQKVIGNQEAEPPFLQITRQTVQWNPDSDYAVDVQEFQEEIDQALRHSDLTTASDQLQTALNCYQGDFLTGFAVTDAPEFDHWVATTREYLHQQLLSAITHVADLAEEAEQYAQVVDLAHRQLAFNPWHEPAHRRLMRALARQGQRAEALTQYDRCYDALQQELGVAPDDETELLYKRILDGELTPVANAASATPIGEHPSACDEVPPETTSIPPTLPTAELPPHGVLPAGLLMPLRRNPHFVGRDADLRALASALDAGGAAAVSQIETAAATGLGGIGKTQLACEFVHRYGQFFPGGVFWMSFDNAEAVPAEIAACGDAGALELRPDFGSRGLDEQVRLVQRAWQMPTPRLLVFDNCEDPALLEQWRPTTGGCRVLVTSRRGDWELTLGVTMLALGVLTRGESIDLLRKHCPDANADTLFAIAEEVGDLPLALHLAGSYLYRYRRSVSPERYLDELRDPKLLEHPSLTSGDLSPTGHVQHVGRTFALSYDRLHLDDERDALAHTLLVHTVHFAPGEPIWYTLLVKTLGLDPGQSTDARQANDAFERLIELGMIETEENDVLRMHRLVAAFVRDVAQDAVEASQKAVEEVVFEEIIRIQNMGSVSQSV
ncbi:bacterial transcriptional activator domain-containing protein [Chloroflexi bacterium TSY]|nr:bacterial transcriptional activator domain-containing protein [Chloroflexi bacterium TSY]